MRGSPWEEKQINAALGSWADVQNTVLRWDHVDVVTFLGAVRGFGGCGAPALGDLDAAERRLEGRALEYLYPKLRKEIAAAPQRVTRCRDTGSALRRASPFAARTVAHVLARVPGSRLMSLVRREVERLERAVAASVAIGFPGVARAGVSRVKTTCGERDSNQR